MINIFLSISVTIEEVYHSYERTNKVNKLKMDAETVMLLLMQIANAKNIEVNGDMRDTIYEAYEGCYENYTLLELINLLDKSNIAIPCPWNKKAIIEMIKTNDLDVPKKQEEIQSTVWKHCSMIFNFYAIEAPGFEFYEGYIIQLADGMIYEIDVGDNEQLISEDLPEDDPDSCENMIYVHLLPSVIPEFQEFPVIHMTADEFMHTLDYENVTILQDRKRGYYMNQEQETYWRPYNARLM